MRLILVGYGKMGQALLQGWLAMPDIDRIMVIDPDRKESKISDQRIEWHWDECPPPAMDSPDIIIVAVKPPILAKVLSAYKGFVASQTLFISIVAGKPLSWLSNQLGSEAIIIRAMPNMPAMVHCGITVAVANSHATPMHVAMADGLFRSIGELIWIHHDEESLMDPITAISGSGPAYVFLLIETLARAGIAQGLSADLAMSLARATVIGSSTLAQQSPESIAMLRQSITSPGGTTEAALAVLMRQGGFDSLLGQAIQAATNRARELATLEQE